MPGQLPSRTGAAQRAWIDLAATVQNQPLLSALSVAACTAISLVNSYVDTPHDASTLAVARGFGLAVTEAFAITPMLLASHRFIILGETMRDYAGALSSRRFWRFFLLSAAIVALAFVPVLLASWSMRADGIVAVALAAGVVAFLAASVLLSLLFPAIAVDAPGTGVRNAIADLWDNVWRIFWAGTLAILPMAALAMIVGLVRAALVGTASAWTIDLVFAPLEGAMNAATYVLLVLIASRFYLAAADRLSASPASATPPE